MDVHRHSDAWFDDCQCDNVLDYRACDDQCNHEFRWAPLVYVLNDGSFGRASLDYTHDDSSIRRAHTWTDVIYGTF